MLKNLKKYIPKRKYRERSQLESRKNKGFLEKKQDYKVRADDYHRKESRVKKLKESARLKNPDEFYFQMTNSKVIEGENYSLPLKEEDLGKSQLKHQKLVNLVNYRKSLHENATRKAKEDLAMMNIGIEKEFVHTIFVGSEAEAREFNPKEYFETELIDNVSNRIKNSQLGNFRRSLNEEEIKQVNAEKKRNYQRLIEKTENLNSLSKISSTLEYQKHLLKPGKKRKMDDVEGIYKYRFFSERKK